jgi:hypothetical protein
MSVQISLVVLDAHADSDESSDAGDVVAAPTRQEEQHAAQKVRLLCVRLSKVHLRIYCVHYWMLLTAMSGSKAGGT